MSNSTNNNNNTNTNNSSNNKKKEDEPLYISIELPDTRKRLTITYINDDKEENNENTINLMISNNLSFQGFLSTLINRFQLATSIKPRLRVKTTDGRRITDLSMVYNNQLVYLSISKLSTSNEFNESIMDLLNAQKPKEQSQRPDQLDLFDDANENQNEFLQDLKKLKQIYKNKVILGESYPYRCKVIVGNDEKRDYLILYLIEPITTSEGEKKKVCENFKLFSENTTLHSQISTFIMQELKELTDIVEFVKLIFQHYSTVANSSPTLQLDGKSKLIFPENIKCPTTQTINKYVSDSYQKIDYVAKHVDIPSSLARDILFKCNWQLPIALNYLKDKKKIFPTPPSSNENITHKCNNIARYKFKGLNIPKEKTEEECSICYCDYDVKTEMIELLCGHRFCFECLGRYTSTSLDDGNGNSTGICCPQIGCENKLIDEVTVESLIYDDKVYNKALNNFYNDLLYTSFAKWCSSPSCSRVVPPQSKSLKATLPFVLCECKANLCLYCNKKDFHWPLSCSTVSDAKDELESISWIARFTTPCPGCRYPVERNQGCNHMTCSRCKMEFCYVCGANYHGHICKGASVSNKIGNFINRYLSNSPAAASYLEMKYKIFYDELVATLYNNFILALFSPGFTRFKPTLENLIGRISFICNKKNKDSSIEAIDIRVCANLMSCLFSQTAQKISSANQAVEIIQDRSRVLIANICLNGSKKIILPNQFVFTQFFQFKQDICKNLKKSPLGLDSDPSKLKIYSQYGGEIKSSNEVIFSERLYICLDKSEKFLQPEEYEEPPSKEEQEEVQLMLGEKLVSFNVLDTKKKRSSNIENLKKQQQNKKVVLDKLQVDQNTTVTVAVDENEINNNNNNNNEQQESDSSISDNDNDDEETLASLSPEEREKKEKEIRDLMKEFENNENNQVEIFNKVLEIYKDESTLNFEQVYQICTGCSTLDDCLLAMSDYFDEKNHFKNYSPSEKEIIIKDKIMILFPNLSQTIIYRAITENNCDLEASTSWLLSKYGTLINEFGNMSLHNTKNQNNNNNQKKEKIQRTIQVSYGSETYDEDFSDDYDYDEYDDYVDNIKLHPAGHTHWY